MATPKEGRKLFVVEDIFQLSGRGLVAYPGPPFDIFGTRGSPHSCLILIERPDGSSISAQATFYLSLISPPKAMRAYMERGCYECAFTELTKADVPIGSEIYELEQLLDEI